MRTDLKSDYTRWLQNYCPVKLKTDAGENYDDWIKSFPKNVKVDNTLVVFDECQGGPYTYQPFATKVKDSKLQLNCCQLLIEEDCHYERNEILSGTMWSNILSTSVNNTH